MLTAWDGYARVDFVAAPRLVRVTLLTAEPTVFRKVRSGLGCAFAADDAGGPPTFVEVDIGAGLGDDEQALFGERLTSAISGLVADRAGSLHLRLALDEIARLADAWAPYRSEVLDVETVSGAWTGGLWTWLRDLNVLDAWQRSAPLVAAVRGDAPDAYEGWPEIRLPADLARAAGVREVLRWQVLGAPDSVVLVLVTSLPGTTPRLRASLDDGTGTWVPFEEEPEIANGFLAELPFDPALGDPALRLRTGGTPE
ncbi:hypothetical protein ACSHWB_34460 [Lentzea sp. HUAS TT2]|uniref:hypothetical protein n=1 Tax=Lentzea sp. HUAS TT2 TaxID=3447454 RepID=UPI003F7097C1